MIYKFCECGYNSCSHQRVFGISNYTSYVCGCQFSWLWVPASTCTCKKCRLIFVQHDCIFNSLRRSLFCSVTIIFKHMLNIRFQNEKRYTCRKRKGLTDHIHNEATEKHGQQNEARQAPKRKSSKPRKQNCSVKSISHSRRSGSRQDTTEQEAGVNLMLGNIWMGKTKRDPGLEIIIRSTDDIENVYRPDIAQLWKIADELMETDDKMRFKCRVCQFFSSKQGHLREHIGALHLALPEWMCRYCPYKNCRRPAVVDHLKSEHKRVKLCVVRCRPYQRNEEVENIVSTTTIKAFCRLTKEGIKYLAQSVLNLDLRCSLVSLGHNVIEKIRGASQYQVAV